MWRKQKLRAGYGLALLTLAGCGAGGAAKAPDDPSPGARECARRLPPRAPALASARRAALAKAQLPSQLVVHAETELAPLLATLESRIQQRLAEGRVRIGPAGTLSYSVERGALSLGVAPSQLVVEAPVNARAEACRGDDCYASCEPSAVVRAEVPLLLGPDYRFRKSAVSLRFTRGCKVRALGGLLTLDITPTLQAQLAPELERVGREIDAQLPDWRAELEQAWAEVSTPRELPLGGCFVLQPQAVVQGPFTPSSQLLRGRFALLATPELRSRCGELPARAPLPPLRTDLALPEQGALRLGLVTPLAQLERALESAGAVRVSGKQLRVAHATVTAQGDDVALELELAGEVCGSLALEASVDFGAEGASIGLTRVQLAPGERERLSGSQLDPSSLAQALGAAPHLTPLLSVPALQAATPGMIQALAPPTLEARAELTATRGAGASARDEQLVAWVEARGALWLKQK